VSRNDDFCACGDPATRGPYCEFHALEWLLTGKVTIHD